MVSRFAAVVVFSLGGRALISVPLTALTNSASNRSLPVFGPAEASGAAVQVGGARARHLRAGVVDDHLDEVAVGGQAEGEGAAAGEQGVGDEFGDDQDDGVGRF
ncbi:hypothetical protein JL475_37280 [Streptomyces sp. M2CJ-2]|nr:hypothetical protein [Streptomyces sp. M2CJ-2]